MPRQIPRFVNQSECKILCNYAILLKIAILMKYVIYWTADVKSNKLWSSVVNAIFACVRKPEKFLISTGFEFVTSRYQLSYEATGIEGRSFVASKQPVRNEWLMKYVIYWTADVKSNKLWSSQLWTQFFSKIGFITVRIIAYLLAILPQKYCLSDIEQMSGFN